MAIIENNIAPSSLVIFSSTAGKGGTAIANLIKGSAWYNAHFLLQLNGAKALYNDIACHFIPFQQGETDLDASPPTTYSVWRSTVEQFQVDAETDIKSIYGQATPVFILTYQTSYKAALSSNIALAQLDLAQKNPKFFLTTPCYHLPFYTDGTHLTAVGYAWLGHYIGRAEKKILIDKVMPKWLNPISASIYGNVISVYFDVPVKPLTIDTTTLAATTNYGFRVIADADSSTVAITSITAKSDHVEITLSATPTGSVSVRYGLDYLGTGLNILNGGSGNLRDSDPTTISISGSSYPLYNVCPHFQLSVITVGE